MLLLRIWEKDKPSIQLKHPPYSLSAVSLFCISLDTIETVTRNKKSDQTSRLRSFASRFVKMMTKATKYCDNNSWGIAQKKKKNSEKCFGKAALPNAIWCWSVRIKILHEQRERSERCLIRRYAVAVLSVWNCVSPSLKWLAASVGAHWIIM